VRVKFELRTVIPLLAVLVAFRVHAVTDAQINSTLLQDQERQAAVQLANGTLVFVYEDKSVTNGQILLRGFDANLTPLRGEQRVNVLTNGERAEPVIAAFTGGGFVVAYTAGNLDGDNYAVAFRRYDANASALDVTDVLANTITNAAQFRPQIAALANGGFVITWVGQSGGTGQDVYYRRFAATGTALDATDVQANGLGAPPVTTGDQGAQRVTTLLDGSFVIVYEDRSSDDVYGVRIAANGVAMDAPGSPSGVKQFLVNSATPYEQTAPAVAALTNGGFVVTFNSEPGGTASARQVRGRIFPASGTGGAEFQIGAHANRWQDSQVAGLPNGDFVVTWQARGEGVDAGTNTWSVFEQRFSPLGVPRFTPFMVNSYNANDQDRPTLATFANSGYLIAWESFGQDASRYGVFARAFLPNNEIPGFLTLHVAPTTQATLVNFLGQPGRWHQLQFSTNLTVWTSVLTTNPPAGVFQYVEPFSVQSNRFFRVQSL